MGQFKTRVHAIQCPKCKDIIYSRARHDYHSCTCGDVTIDGGFDYMHCSWKVKPPKELIKYIPVTRTRLFVDWNFRRDQFGIIKGGQ